MKAILSAEGKVLELSANPESKFHPDYAAEFVTVPATAKLNQIKKGNKFVDQEDAPVVEPAIKPSED